MYYFEDNDVFDCVDAMRQNSLRWNSGFQPVYTLDGAGDGEEEKEEVEDW